MHDRALACLRVNYSEREIGILLYLDEQSGYNYFKVRAFRGTQMEGYSRVKRYHGFLISLNAAI